MGFYEFSADDAYRFARFVGIRARQRGDELIFSKCPYCGGNSNDKDKFAINLKTGQYNCLRNSCQARGNMIRLSKDFNFQISEELDRYLNRNNFNGRFKKFKEGHRESTDKAVEYMKSRGISEEICRKYEITSREKDGVIVFPFRDQKGDLRFIKYRNPDFKQGDKGSKEWCEADCMPILFGMYQSDPSEKNSTLIITEGQIDSLSVAEAGFQNAVSVPTGALGSTWVPHCYSWVNGFKEIVIFGDCENGKITLTDMIQSRFRNLMIRIVRMEDYRGCKDANEILRVYGKEAIRRAVDNAESVLNKKVKDMAEVKAVDLDKIPKISTGFKELDKILKGGFMYGQVILLTGKRGNGKSTCGSMFVAEALAQNVNAFIYSGELPDFFVKSWIDGQIYGKTNLTNSEIEKCEDFYRGRLFVFNNQFIEGDEFEDLLAIVEDTIVKKDLKFILLDNLMTAITATTNESLYRKQSEFVGKLAEMAKRYEVVIMLVAHPRKMTGTDENDNISGTADITNRVDVVMSYDKLPEKEHPADNERVLKVTKNRLTGKLGNVRLYYSEDSKRISDDKDNFAKNYLKDVEFRPAEDYEDIPY